MNEYEPYMQDTGHRPFERMDFAAQAPAHLPAVLIVDSAGRDLYPLSSPTWHDSEVAARFSATSPRLMDEAILARFDSLADLARAFGIDPSALQATVATWNALAASQAPDPLGRPAMSRLPIATAPFFAAQVWPIVSNTQGGPAHDARQRVLDAFGAPIPHLFEAGEVGSVFGHVYMSGGNLAECFVGGRIAGREAARVRIEEAAA
jgi:succinate dehydrogenase/fumarate reductase flavoprotein subunit